MEQEDDAEKDLKYYRRVTLKQGVKTLKEKEEEKRRKEAEEDEKLFGEITDDSHQHDRNLTTSKKEHEHNTRSKRKKSISVSCRKRRNTSTESTEAIQGKRLCVQNNNIEGDDDEMIEEEDEDHHSDSREPRLRSMQTKKKNRRTIRKPVKNLKPRNVSFLDCSYWQK